MQIILNLCLLLLLAAVPVQAQTNLDVLPPGSVLNPYIVTPTPGPTPGQQGYIIAPAIPYQGDPMAPGGTLNPWIATPTPGGGLVIQHPWDGVDNQPDAPFGK